MDAQKILAHMRRKMIEHPNYVDVYRRLYTHASFGRCDSVIFLVGPTRVGKTSLSKEVARDLIRENLVESEVPLIRVEAETTSGGFISTRYLCLRMLEELRHPFYVGDGYHPRMRDSETMLRSRLNSALKARGTKYVFIDEAHHLFRTKSNRLKIAALDTLKCLANQTEIILIVFGGYELLQACFESSHLNGRSIFIDFCNYRAEQKDIEIYDRLLVTFDAQLPWSNGASLLKHRELIYEGTQGCFGLLMDWVELALKDMKATRSRVLKIEHFRRTRLREQIDKIEEEIEIGKALMHYMGESSGSRSVYDIDAKERPHKRRRRYPPGVRNPKRDPVGRR